VAIFTLGGGIKPPAYWLQSRPHRLTDNFPGDVEVDRTISAGGAPQLVVRAYRVGRNLRLASLSAACNSERKGIEPEAGSQGPDVNTLGKTRLRYFQANTARRLVREGHGRRANPSGLHNARIVSPVV